MARTIQKSISSATINVFDPSKEFTLDENGMPLANVQLACDGAPSLNKARIIAEKALKSKNIMVLSVDVDETKLKVTPDVFYANSTPCIDGEVYGREYITQTLKITNVSGFYTSKDGMHQFWLTYDGVTTDSKLLKFVRDETECPTAVITNSEIVEERRYMTRERYLELAR